MNLFESGRFDESSVNRLSLLLTSAMARGGLDLEGVAKIAAGPENTDLAQDYFSYLCPFTGATRRCPGRFDYDLTMCIHSSLWLSPVPAFRCTAADPSHGPGKRAFFINKAGMKLFGVRDLNDIGERIRRMRPIFWMHPSTVAKRMVAETRQCRRGESTLKFKGMYLQERWAGGRVSYAPFTATEIINHTYDSEGHSDAFTSYLIDINFDMLDRPTDLAELAKESQTSIGRGSSSLAFSDGSTWNSCPPPVIVDIYALFATSFSIRLPAC